MGVTSNTSPVIALAKMGRLEVLKELYDSVLLPTSVKVECVDKGKELGAADARNIERAIEEGWIKVVKLDGRQKRTVRRLISRTNIGAGEAEALVLARDRNLLAILDDKEARAVAKGWKVEHQGTAMVLYEAYVKGKLSYDQLIEELTELSKVMWISSDVLTEIIKRAKGVRK